MVHRITPPPRICHTGGGGAGNDNRIMCVKKENFGLLKYVLFVCLFGCHLGVIFIIAVVHKVMFFAVFERRSTFSTLLYIMQTFTPLPSWKKSGSDIDFHLPVCCA